MPIGGHIMPSCLRPAVMGDDMIILLREPVRTLFIICT